MSNKIKIYIQSDGFAIEFENKHYSFNQEDDPSDKLKKLFNNLGYEVDIVEDY